MDNDLANQHSATQTERRVDGFGVAASPFNKVKFELGIIMCIGVLLWLAVDSITAHVGAQLLILFSYSLTAMIWLVVRTRKIVRSFAKANTQSTTSENSHGTQ